MDGQEDVAPEIVDLPHVRSRIPLIPRSPPRTPPKQIRRKGSFMRRVDSSEESPSPHGSIFEALYQSATNSEEGGHVELWPTRPLPVSSQPASPSETRENDENTRQLPTSTNTLVENDGQFLYGHGTVLETIKERTSHGSIRILARRKSVDDLKSIPVPDQIGRLAPGKNPQRQKSLSLDDLETVKDSYMENSLAGSTTKHALAIQEIYAQPRVPIKEPPYRPDTPPGMPSWTEHQLRPAERPRPSVGFREFFGIRSSRTKLQHGEQSLPDGGRSVSGLRVPRIARFRPPKSSYGRIDQHPFNSAPTAVVDPFLHVPTSIRPVAMRKLVRFTPSTAAQDSEATPPQGGVEQGDSSATQHTAQVEPESPIQGRHSRPSGPKKRRECPHRKARVPAFKKLKHSNSTILGIDYQAILSHPLTRDASHTSLPQLAPPSPTHPVHSAWCGRGDGNWDLGIIDTETISGVVSNSSTTHLMSGALLAASPSPTPESSHREDRTLLPPPIKNSRCWRCKLEALGDRLGSWRKKSTGCLWFVCCGFDADEEGSTYTPRNVRVELAGQANGREGGRPRDRWWGAEESPLGRRGVFDYAYPWIV